jgi:hypothetical protein
LPSKGIVKTKLNGVEQLDPHTGKIYPYPYNKENNSITFSFELPPVGSLLLFLSKNEIKTVKSNFTSLNRTYRDISVKKIQPKICC